MLSEVWTTLSGVSGVCLACSLLSAAVVLRWTGRQKARGAATRARQKQRASLETMDKAVQRFRLQVKAGAGAGVGWRGQGSSARGPAGRQRSCEPRNRNPLLELMHSVLFLRQVQRKGKWKRKGQVVEAGRCTGSKRSFVPGLRISITDYQNAGGKKTVSLRINRIH